MKKTKTTPQKAWMPIIEQTIKNIKKIIVNLKREATRVEKKMGRPNTLLTDEHYYQGMVTGLRMGANAFEQLLRDLG